MVKSLPLSVRLRYWRSLLDSNMIKIPHLLPGHADELRAALRDAIHELEKNDDKSA